MRARAGVALLLLAGSALAAPAPDSGHTERSPELTVVARTLMYDIGGHDRQTVGEALRRQGVLLDDGRDYRGAYVWRLHWNYRYRPDGYGCRMTAVQIELTAVTTLPRWIKPAATEAGLETAWRQFSERLQRHEARHHEITLERSRPLRAAMQRLRARDCEALKQEADALGQQTVERIRTANQEYDRQTDHGAREGVRWPPP